MKSFFTIILIAIHAVLFAQSGKIVLVGGGSESDADYSWSNVPFEWGVDESSNKKVAIITYASGGSDDWFPNYFKSLGATAATNFEITTSALADNQSTYDDLMAYDVFYFKGGDQYEYYSLYQNSKVSEAIQDKFAEGGVIMGTSAGMAMLSKVFYSAEKSTLYPDQALSNIEDANITLENDFLDIFDGVIVDTHFAERGRFPRLLAFMGNWKINQNETLMGIGVDDKTALCIDENSLATAYGTGAVSIYQMNDFTQDEGRPVADDIRVTHLIHEMSYDLENLELSGTYSLNTSAKVTTESIKSTLMLSGSDALSHNENMLDDLLAKSSDQIVVIAKPDSELLASYQTYIENNSSLKVIELEASLQDDCEGVSLRNKIKASNSFLVLDLDSETMMDFFETDETGQLLLDQMKRSTSKVAFVGSSSAYAGSFYCTNNLADELNAYNGDLAYTKGLGLLQTTLIMPNAFDQSSTTYFENNTAAVLYGMTDLQLGFGLYLNERTYVTIDQKNDENQLTSTGKYSSILVQNTSSKGGKANQPVNSSGNTRNIVGFDQMSINLISGQEIVIGTPSNTADPSLIDELEYPEDLSANWSDNGIELTWINADQSIDAIQVYRKVNEGSMELLVSLDADQTEYLDLDTEENKAYSYAIEVKNEADVSCLSSSVDVDVLLNANTIKSGNLIYPNPVTNGFVQLPKNFENHLTYKILDLSGKVLLDRHVRFPQRELDLTSLPNGSFLLQLQSGNDFQIHKLMIDHE